MGSSLIDLLDEFATAVFEPILDVLISKLLTDCFVLVFV